MKIGLVGLPMSGKTTIFNLATRSSAQTKDFFSKSDEVNAGVIKVPDKRIDFLAKIFNPKKVTYATIEFIDIAGIVREEPGFSRQTLSNIKLCDAIMAVIRLFKNDEIPHVKNVINPISDLEDIILELIFSDLEIIEKRLDKLEKEAKTTKKQETLKELSILQKAKKALEENIMLNQIYFTHEEEISIRSYKFLTQKPFMVVANCSDEQIKDKEDVMLKQFIDYCDKKKFPIVSISGKTEMEIANLSPEEEEAFLKEFGIEISGRTKLIQKAYEIMNYISFITVGEDEVRAWPIKLGTTAVKAAGVVHSDMERGFIKAEVISYKDFEEKKSLNAIKQAGLMRLEGKDYIVKDGDIIHFRFSV